ncbi:pilus assembly FimT family protein [Thalassotalea castellviae]|uniref:Prepilin-type N-terminal cleavage/methylation domain-containing protein n=1 Tax=Thalassotalea castellviae TaxID=3075612 RepID=A0ABU2ZY07_9GAMM|nr:prepilin-type N-terminal cleavage/methylation domain-containing protein [Thalassotalea sp. W431]MDT0602816.1 prepilin-type N-terminal cleavage/methylation domain-containing protein [Thalassotalea sp. W431]
MLGHTQTNRGFTLIELMIVMSIVALLMGMVGPLAINSLEKAQAKQEMLSLKNWFRKISARAFHTGQAHIVELTGKKVTLFVEGIDNPIETTSFESLFFQPQKLYYNKKGFISENKVTGTYRGKPLMLELATWVNGEQLSNENL